jgi:hypothetical protein
VTAIGGIHLESIFDLLKEGKDKFFGDEYEIDVWTISDQARVSTADWYVGNNKGGFINWLDVGNLK